MPLRDIVKHERVDVAEISLLRYKVLIKLSTYKETDPAVLLSNVGPEIFIKLSYICHLTVIKLSLVENCHIYVIKLSYNCHKSVIFINLSENCHMRFMNVS